VSEAGLEPLKVECLIKQDGLGGLSQSLWRENAMKMTLSVKEIGQFKEDTQLVLDNLDVLQGDAPIAIMSLRMVRDVNLKVGQNVRVTLQPLDEKGSQYRQPPLLFSQHGAR
jgi:hypothetical protein